MTMNPNIMVSSDYPHSMQNISRRKYWRPLPWPIRFSTWVLIVMQVVIPVFPQVVQAMESTPNQPSPVAVNSPQMPPPAPIVTVNRTIPKVTPPSSGLQFSTPPTDLEISRVHIFEEVLQPVGATTTQDNQDLVDALLAFLKRTNGDDMSAITRFLETHPQSPWRASLLTDLGLIYRHTGWFSKSLACLEEAWQLTKDEQDAKAHMIGDRAVAELLEFNGRLGHYDQLETLFGEIKGRILNSAVSEKITGAREGLWSMENRPEVAFRCGPMALSRILTFQQSGTDTNRLIKNSRSTVKGMSLSGVCDLANKLGMNYQMVRRQPGSQFILPAVIHWKVGHYAALLKEINGLYLVQDPAFGDEYWASRAVLEAEASGYFLVRDGDLPQGWSPVTVEEGQNVWGKGLPPNGSNPNNTKKTDKKNPPCPPKKAPMAQYAFHAMLVSLNIVDTPVGYTPPRGPDVHFQVTYNQREANQVTTRYYSNVGPKWTCNWLSYIQDNVTLAPENQSVSYYVPGGGMVVYPSSTYNSTSKTYAADPDTHAVLQVTSSTNYTLFFPDGSQQIFSQPGMYSMGGISYPNRQLFLTQIVDSSSNALTFVYDNMTRLIAVVDALGQVTTFEYQANVFNDPFGQVISKVTDPFGRSATFHYNQNSGLLESITDILGITSTFTYGLSDAGTMDFITSMTTPYGTTTFAEGATHDANGNKRWLMATDPLGQQEREEYQDTSAVISASDPAAIVPAGLGLTDNYLQYRNTFYWDKKAMQLYPGDYTKARLQHWLHTDDYSTCAGTEESTKDPLESRVWMTYAGQPDSIRLGTNNSPAAVARVLDDGSSQIYKYQYNSCGKVAQVIDPTNRTTGFIYAANNIDLLQVYQMVSVTSSNVLSQFAYNSLHLPLMAVNAAGKTNFFGYNTNGQLLIMTNAINEVVFLNYNTNGYLTNIVAGTTTQRLSTNSFTYDGYGRVRTMTDPMGYTITTSYDAADRPTNITYMDGTYQQIVYNNLDAVMEKDRNGHWTAQAYDALRHLTDTYDNLGRHTQFSWCGCGSLESITDPLGRVTAWARDLEGRVKTKTFPDSTQINYTYETNTSRLQMVTDAKNQSTIYSYFIDNNLKQVTYSNAVVATPSVSFTYDTNYNRLLKMVDGAGTNTYSYYPVASGQLGAGMLSSVSNLFIGSSGTVTYNYDALGRITNRAINNVSQQFTYDMLNRISIVTNALGRFTNTYVGSTMLIATNFAPYGKKTIFSYLGIANDERLSEIWNQKTNGVTLSKFDYSYDPVGQITNWTQQADAGTPTAYTYQYDAGNQLMSAVLKTTGVGASIIKQFAYGYDLSGNRTSEQIGTTAANPVGISQSSYNNLNQMTSRGTNSGPVQFAGTLSKQGTVTVAGNAATMNHQTTNFSAYVNVNLGPNTVQIIATDYGNHSQVNNYLLMVTNNGMAKTIRYDLNGNETNVVTATSTNNYQWDAANRLVSITTITNQTRQSLFIYDGLGRRVQDIEKVNGVATSTNKYLWNGMELCEERNNIGTTVTKRFFGGGEQIGGVNYYFTRDHLGSVREMVDASGVIQARYDYDPYGRVTKVSGAMNADFGYAGMYYHATSGLNFTLYRAYDSDLGRWPNRDTIGELGGLNLYGYVGNNPVNFYDPLGLLWYDDLATYVGNSANAAKDIVNNSLPPVIAIAVDTAIDLGNGLASAPAAIGHLGEATGATGEIGNEPVLQPLSHLGEGTGTFSVNPTLENSAGVFQDISTAAGVMAITLDQLPIGKANIGWKGGELTFTQPGASTPDLRINPCGGSGYPPHYHRRPGIGKHRPWDGGF